MKKTKLILLMMLSSVLIFGCGNKNTEEIVEEPVKEVVEEVEEEPEEVVEEEPEEVLPAGKKRSSLTNEIISEDVANTRPIAIMLPTDKSAQPQYGIGKAGILYECMEEGNMSRQMAIIEDWQDMGQIGNVRSSRDYYVYWALEWDSILVHFGGPYYLADIVMREDVDNITGCTVNNTSVTPGAGAFYRTTDKEKPHNAYTSGENLVSAINKLEYSLKHREDLFEENHFVFAKDSEPNTLKDAKGSIDAKSIDLSPAFPYTISALEYNESEGKYYKTLYGSAQNDGTTGEQLTFENVIVQYTYHESRDANGYLSFQCHDTTRDGYFFTNGKAIHVSWYKTSDYEPTRYYDDDGNEIMLNSGKTYIAVVEHDDAVIVDGKEIYSSNK